MQYVLARPLLGDLMATAQLPPHVAAMLDGNDLHAHVGETLLLCASGPDDWPHVAMLSVGEVLAVGPDELRFVLYAGSGTTRTITGTGRALLMLVVDGVAYKVTLRMVRRELPTEAGTSFRGFTAAIVSCHSDEVGYARILHGIEYALKEPEHTVARWREQVRWLRGQAGS